MKIVLLGASHWHASCYYGPSRKFGHEVVLMDDDGPAVRRKAEPRGLAWRDSYAALDDIQPDFAFCLGTHDRMAELTGLCIDRGVPFMAEKPGAPNAAAMRKLAQRCDAAGLFHAAPFCMRWDPAVMHVKSLIDGGALGRIAAVHAAYFGGAASRYIAWDSAWVLDKAKALGGSLYNEGVHGIDLLRYWGLAPTCRAARASWNLNRGDVDDVITLLLDCGDAYAVVESGYLVQNPYGGLSFSLFCEKANLDYRHGELAITWADGKRGAVASGAADVREPMLADTFAALAAGRGAPITLHDMAATLDVCDAAREAM